MNLLDGLILLALIAGAAWGFMKGIIHQLIGLVLIYVAIVVATTFYTVVAPPLGQLVKLPLQPAGAIAFLLLLIVTYNIIGFAFRDIRKREYKVLRLVNQLGGMTFGFVMASIWVALGIAMLHYAAAGNVADMPRTGAPQLATVGSESFRQMVLVGLNGSPLVAAFSVLLPLILNTVSPIAPANNVINIFVIR